MIWLGFLLILSVYGDDTTQNPPVNACLETQELQPELPINSSKTVSFPNDTNATFVENKSCSWHVRIPTGYFVILYINASVPFSGNISVTQSPNHTEKFIDPHVEVALLFVAPSFNLNWFSGNSSFGNIHFTVNWQPFPENMTSQNYTLEKSSSSIVLDHEDTYTPVVFKAATKVSIFCLPGTQREEDTYLRTGIVFDGPDLNSPFLGSLYSISQSQSELISSTSAVTIFSIVPIVSHHHVFVQDASSNLYLNDKKRIYIAVYQNISQITGLNVNESAVEVVKMNANSGKAVVFTYNDNPLIDEYLTSIVMENGAELKVYFEGLSENKKVATYTNKNNKTHLPQKLQGRLRYYVLSSGNATLSLTRDKWKANWEKAFAGRRGFFTSKYWKTENQLLKTQQDSFHFIGEEVRNATQFRFSYRILDADLDGDSNVHVVVSDNVQRIHYYDHRTAWEFTNDTQWYTHFGHSLSLVYSSNNAQSSGFFAEFEIESSSRMCPDAPFTRPADTDQWTWYPNNFTGTQPPMFNNDFNCYYKINVPVGWSADVMLTVNVTNAHDFSVSVQVFDQNHNREVVRSASSEHFFFVAGNGTIQLDTRDKNIMFGFAIKWWQLPTFDPTPGNVTLNAPQPLVWWAQTDSAYQIKAETHVSLVVTPPNDYTELGNLRRMIIYDGPDLNSPCLGNALKVLNSNKQLVSTGQYLTVSPVRPYYYNTGRAMLIFQEYQNTKDIVEYQGFACVTSSFCGLVSLDAMQGPSAVSTVNDDRKAEYLTQVSGSGRLDVYIGGQTITKANLITSYQLYNVSSYLPQEFIGEMRTYVLTGGSAQLVLTRNSMNFTSPSPVGRKGFMASRYYKYGQPMKDNDVYDNIAAPFNELRTFSINIREVDFVGNTTLSVTVNNGATRAYDQTFTSSNKPTLHTVIQARGNSLSVGYQTYGNPTTGYYLDFELSSSSPGLKVFLIVLCSLIFFGNN